jgi:BatD DUF11 like domain
MFVRDLRRFFFLFCFVPFLSFAQHQQVEFRAFADAQQVFIDGYFQITFTLSNGEGDNFRAPNFGQNFVVLEGPSRSQSTTILNGYVSSELSFSYVLQPKQLGRLVIPPASIQVRKQTYRSNPVSIDCIKSKPKAPGKKGAELFVKAEVNASKAYVGQQIRLDYKLYTRVNVEDYNFVEESDYVGFYVEEIQRPDQRVREEVINGARYNSRVIRSMALYPQKAGTLNIEPALLQLGVVNSVPGQEEDRFSALLGAEIKRVPMRTEALQVKANPLPPNAPASFSGGVGLFNINTSLNRTEVSTDEAITLRMSITGDGDMKRVQPPQLNLSDAFEVYEPRIIEEDAGETEGLRVARKTVEYLIMPLKKGEYELRPEFSYFNVQSGEYVTLNDYSYTIKVRQGKNKGKGKNNIAGPGVGMKEVFGLSRQREPWLASPLYWLITLLPLLALGTFVLYQRISAQRASLTSFLKSEKNARKVALSHLNQADTHLKTGDSRAFYDEVSKAILGFLAQKLEIPKAELSRSKISERMQEIQADPGLLQRLESLLQNCEMALFAGKANPEAMQETYSSALEVLTVVEETGLKGGAQVG